MFWEQFLMDTNEPSRLKSEEIPVETNEIETPSMKDRISNSISAVPLENEDNGKPTATISTDSSTIQANHKSTRASKCTVPLQPLTYSTISIPFLAGGELELPDLISAVLACGTTLADSFERNWKKEPETCIGADQRFSLVQMRTTTEIEQASSNRGEEKPTETIAGPLAIEDIEVEKVKPQKWKAVEKTSDFAQTEDNNSVSVENCPRHCGNSIRHVLTKTSSTDVVTYNNEPTLQPYQPNHLQPSKGREDKHRHVQQERPSLALKGRGAALNVLDVDLREVKRMSSQSGAEVPGGLTGFKGLCQTRSFNKPEGLTTDSTYTRKDFMDSFAQKNCVEYIVVLEQIESHFQKRVVSEMKRMHSSLKSYADEMLLKIQALTKVTPAETEKELQDYDFPMILRHDVAKFNISVSKVSKNLDAVLELHNYGVKMVLHWIYLLQDRATIPPETICSVGTDLMSSVMIACYGIFVYIAEKLMKMTDDAESNLNHPPLDKLLMQFKNLMDTTSDELGAVGESGAQILIRTPNVSRERVEENLRELYEQVNYANIALSRAMEALVPLIHCYAITEMSKTKSHIQ